MTRRTGRACGLALFALLVPSAPALAAPGWSPGTTTLGAGVMPFDDADVAVADSGAAAVSFRRNAETALRVAARRSGAEFEASDTVPDAVDGPAALTVDDDGTAVAVYRSGGELRTASRAPGGDFGPSQLLGSIGAAGLDLVTAPDGSAVLAWADAGGLVRVSERKPGGSFGPAATAWPGGEALDAAGASPISVATGSAGRVAVLFSTTKSVGSGPVTTTTRVRSVVRPAADAAFGAAQVIDSDEQLIVRRRLGPVIGADTFLEPRGAFAPDGSLDVVFFRSGSTFFLPLKRLRTAHRSAAGDWAAPTDLEAETEIFMPPSVSLADPAIVPAGDGTAAVWAQRMDAPGFPGMPTTSAIRRGRRGGSAPAISLSAPLASLSSMASTVVRSPRLAPLPGGSTLATWISGTEMRAAVDQAGGDVGAGELLGSAELSSLGGDLVTSAGGAGALVWGAVDAAQNVLRVAVFDGAGPVLSGLAVPETAQEDQPVPMAVKAIDDSGVAKVEWDFGDGAKTTGEQVSRTYADGGLRTVTVTATDARGLTTKRTRTIMVNAVAVADPKPAVPAARDLAAPTLSALKLSRTRFAVAKGATALSAAAKGTVLTYRVDEAARVAVAVERLTKGYRSGTRCAAKKPKARKGRKAKRCELVRTSGTIARSAVSGANRLAFTGRLGRRALASGKYRFALIAVDAAGNRSKPSRVAFTVVKK